MFGCEGLGLGLGLEVGVADMTAGMRAALSVRVIKVSKSRRVKGGAGWEGAEGFLWELFREDGGEGEDAWSERGWSERGWSEPEREGEG